MKNILKGATVIVAVAVLIISIGGGYHRAAGFSQGIENSYWRYHFSYPKCPGGDLKVWGTHNYQIVGDEPIFEGYVTKCKKYSGIVPKTINGRIINDILFEFDWDYECENKDWIKLVLPRWNGENRWELEPLAPWIDVNVDNLSIPTIGDPTGTIQDVYYVIDLRKLLSNPPREQETYYISEGRCW